MLNGLPHPPPGREAQRGGLVSPPHSSLAFLPATGSAAWFTHVRPCSTEQGRRQLSRWLHWG